MKKTMMIIVAGTAFMLSGCGESAVKCDDPNAQKAVISLSEVQIKNLLGRMSPDFTMRQVFSVYNYQVMQQADKKLYPGFPAYLKKVDDMYREAAPALSNIRTEAVDDSLQKSQCAADVSFSDGSRIPITYKLSKTTDGKLYTEVFGF